MQSVALFKNLLDPVLRIVNRATLIFFIYESGGVVPFVPLFPIALQIADPEDQQSEQPMDHL